MIDAAEEREKVFAIYPDASLDHWNMGAGVRTWFVVSGGERISRRYFHPQEAWHDAARLLDLNPRNV